VKTDQVIAEVQQIRYFSHVLPTGGKVHLTCGHQTVMAVATYFRADSPTVTFDATMDHLVLDHLPVQQESSPQRSDGPPTYAFLRLDRHLDLTGT